MKRFADSSRKDAPKYLPGDSVMLSPKNIRTSRPKEKWSDKYIGPYKVIKEVCPGSEAYLLDLPKSIKIHPVFHTSLLVPHIPNVIPNREQPPPPPLMIEGENEYEIEKILDSKMSRNRLKFLVRWKGYTAAADEWIDEGYLEHSEELIAEFNKHKTTRPVAKRRRR